MSQTPRFVVGASVALLALLSLPAAVPAASLAAPPAVGPGGVAMVDAVDPTPAPAFDPVVPANPLDPLGGLANEVAAGGDVSIPQLAKAVREAVLPGRYGASAPGDLGEVYRYTFPIGDVNGDGSEDIGVDYYCVDVDGCGETLNVLASACYTSHRLQVVSGLNAEEIWGTDLDPHHLLPAPIGCIQDLVIGTVPGDGGVNDLLVYRWEAVKVVSAAAINHDFYLLDGRDGRAKWHYRVENGVFGGLVGKDFFLIPILHVPPTQGVRLYPEATQPSLHIRSWGYALAGAVIETTTTGYIGRVYLWQPVEWLAGINLADGSVLWKHDTFQPRADRNVFPESYHAREFRPDQLFPDINYLAFQLSYFRGQACCYDLTGDGVPEVVFTTYEWYHTDLVTPPGALAGYAGRVVVYDGATGDLAWELVVEPDSPKFRGALVQPLGDVNGDGASDLLLLSYYFDKLERGLPVNPRYVLSVRAGTDGAELWKLEDESPISMAPLGDATGDGGNDLLVTWLETGENVAAGLTNFTDIRQEVRVGATGDVLWHTTTFVAGIDLLFSRENYYANGLPDLDGDRVGDFWLDLPEFLPDQTAVHHLRIVSGKTGANITGVATVGAFAFPLGSKDLDGDGRDDFLVMQGDLVDLWITAYSGANGSAHWSRRMLALPQATPLLAVPLFKYHTPQLDGVGAADALVSLTLFTQTGGGGRSVGGATQQILALQGSEGRLLWAAPEVEELDESLVIHAPTPAVQQYQTNVTGSPESATPASERQGAPSRLPVYLGGGAALMASSVAGAYFVAGRRWK